MVSLGHNELDDGWDFAESIIKCIFRKIFIFYFDSNFMLVYECAIGNQSALVGVTDELQAINWTNNDSVHW